MGSILAEFHSQCSDGCLTPTSVVIRPLSAPADFGGPMHVTVPNPGRHLEVHLHNGTQPKGMRVLCSWNRKYMQRCAQAYN